MKNTLTLEKIKIQAEEHLVNITEDLNNLIVGDTRKLIIFAMASFAIEMVAETLENLKLEQQEKLNNSFQ